MLWSDFELERILVVKISLVVQKAIDFYVRGHSLSSSITLTLETLPVHFGRDAKENEDRFHLKRSK